MHEAKIEANIPFSTPSGPDGVEIIADVDGCQLNVIIDGTSAFQIKLNKFLEFELVNHSTSVKIFETNLERIYEAEINDELPADQEHYDEMDCDPYVLPERLK